MRKIIIIVFLFLPLSIWGQDTYYVATNGSDDNEGTITQPFLTPEKAISVMSPGDTIYFRGGVYMRTSRILLDPLNTLGGGAVGLSGEPGLWLHFFNYPGEYPIFDFSNFPVPGGTGNDYIQGWFMLYSHFVHMRGLTFRNLQQGRDHVEVLVVMNYGGVNVTFDRITIHDNGGCALRTLTGIGAPEVPYDYDTVIIVNCDFYNNFDALPFNSGVGAGKSGNQADGAFGNSVRDGYMLVRGNRAWNNSDDGFDFTGSQLTIYDSNWSFLNGYGTDGDGTGIKLGGVSPSDEDIMRVNIYVFNNILAFNRSGTDKSGGNGLQHYELIGQTRRNNAIIYNNLLYDNETAILNGYMPSYPEVWSQHYNNIIYKYISAPHTGSGVSWMHENAFVSNTWEGSWYGESPSHRDIINVTDNDFREINGNRLDSIEIVTQLTAPRKPDGSLPDITVFRLDENSSMKGAGTYVGMSANPDMGIDWAWIDSQMYKDIRYGRGVQNKSSIVVEGRRLIF